MNYDYIIEEDKISFKEGIAPSFKFMLKASIGLIGICVLGYLLQNIIGLNDMIVRGVMLFFMAIFFLVFTIQGTKLKSRSLAEALLSDAYNSIKKEKYRKAKNILENTFMTALNKAYKEPFKNEIEARIKITLYVRYMELNAFIVFNNFIETGEEDIKNNLLIDLDNIIKAAGGISLNQKVACAYANKAIVNLFMYEVMGLNEYKLRAREDYNKSIEYMANNNIKQKLANRFKNIA